MNLPVLLSLLLLCCGCVSDSARHLTTRQKYERLAQTQPGYQLLAFSEDDSFIIAVMGKTASGSQELAVQLYVDSTDKISSFGKSYHGASFDLLPDGQRPYLLNKSGGYDLLPLPPECTLIKEGGKATVHIKASSATNFKPSYLVLISYTQGRPNVAITRADSTSKGYNSDDNGFLASFYDTKFEDLIFLIGRLGAAGFSPDVKDGRLGVAVLGIPPNEQDAAMKFLKQHAELDSLIIQYADGQMGHATLPK